MVYVPKISKVHTRRNSPCPAHQWHHKKKCHPLDDSIWCSKDHQYWSRLQAPICGQQSLCFRSHASSTSTPAIPICVPRRVNHVVGKVEDDASRVKVAILVHQTGQLQNTTDAGYSLLRRDSSTFAPWVVYVVIFAGCDYDHTRLDWIFVAMSHVKTAYPINDPLLLWIPRVGQDFPIYCLRTHIDSTLCKFRHTADIVVSKLEEDVRTLFFLLIESTQKCKQWRICPLSVSSVFTHKHIINIWKVGIST